MLALKRDVNSVLVAGTFYAVDIIFFNKALLIYFTVGDRTSAAMSVRKAQ